MTRHPDSFHRHRSAFTLLEVLLSSALIVLVMVFLLASVDQTRRTINSTTARMNQFQAARAGFEAMTRNLSQATLNTYWDLDFNGSVPIRYRRQSDLHFVMDRAANLGLPTSSPAKYPTHSVFFEAPLGQTTTPSPTNAAQRKYGSLNNLLSVVGYYVEWNEDTSNPAFIADLPDRVPKRFRYRLMEVIQPAEYNMVYNNVNYTTITDLPVSPPSPYTSPRDWISVALGIKPLPSSLLPKGAKSTVNSAHILAENIVALVMVPKVSERDRSSPDALNDLTTNFTYDSRPTAAFKNQVRDTPTTTTHQDLTGLLTPIQRKQMHQLPPIIQVTMVAIDEESAARLQSYSTTPPDWANGLFSTCTTQTALSKELGDSISSDPNSYAARLNNADHSQPTPKMNYRVFTSDVPMRASKWSRNSN
jgi:uncharacterized protein (TIGR02599 family)